MATCSYYREGPDHPSVLSFPEWLYYLMVLYLLWGQVVSTRIEGCALCQSSYQFLWVLSEFLRPWLIDIYASRRQVVIAKVNGSFRHY